MGRLAAITLGVGHARGDDQVVPLQALEQAQEAGVIPGAVLLIDIPGEGVHHGNTVQSCAALKAGAGELAHAPLHAVLVDEIIGAGGNVQKAVDPLADIRGFGGGQLRVIEGELVGGGQRIDGGTDHRVVHRFLDPLAEQVDLKLTAAQAVDVVFRGLQPPLEQGPSFGGDIGGGVGGGVL